MFAKSVITFSLYTRLQHEIETQATHRTFTSLLGTRVGHGFGQSMGCVWSRILYLFCVGLFYLTGWVRTWIMLRLITSVVSSTMAIIPKRENVRNSFALELA